MSYRRWVRGLIARANDHAVVYPERHSGSAHDPVEPVQSRARQWSARREHSAHSAAGCESKPGSKCRPDAKLDKTSCRSGSSSKTTDPVGSHGSRKCFKTPREDNQAERWFGDQGYLQGLLRLQPPVRSALSASQIRVSSRPSEWSARSVIHSRRAGIHTPCRHQVGRRTLPFEAQRL